MEPDMDDLQARAEIDQMYKDYVVGENRLTLPSTLFAIGFSLSATGALLTYTSFWLALAGFVLMGAGVGLIGLSCKLKYKRIKAARVRFNSDQQPSP